MHLLHPSVAVTRGGDNSGRSPLPSSYRPLAFLSLSRCSRVQVGYALLSRDARGYERTPQHTLRDDVSQSARVMGIEFRRCRYWCRLSTDNDRSPSMPIETVVACNSREYLQLFRHPPFSGGSPFGPAIGFVISRSPVRLRRVALRFQALTLSPASKVAPQSPFSHYEPATGTKSGIGHAESSHHSALSGD